MTDKRRSYRIQLGCKPWRVKFERLADCDGYASAKSRTIAIDERLSEPETLRVVLHEMLHALYWFLDEDVVDEASKEIAEALHELDLV